MGKEEANVRSSSGAALLSLEMGCHFLLWGIFQMQGLNSHLLCWQVFFIFFFKTLSHQGTSEFTYQMQKLYT